MVTYCLLKILKNSTEKKAADEGYAENAKKLSELSKDYSESVELNDKMAKYDETDLDRIENEVGELIQKKDPTALSYYLKTYVPARKFQSENFLVLKKMVNERSQKMIAGIGEQKKTNSNWSITLLLGSMIFGLGIIVAVTRKAVAKIQGISSDINQTVVEVNVAAAQIDTSSQRLTESTAGQATALQETASALEEITSMVNKAHESAQRSAEYCEKTKAKAQSGKESMNSMLVAIDDINAGNQEILEQVKNSSAQMTQFIQLIEEISNKTKVINEIVFQTKLLSFNASVEAARAGEQGKGFAVVAEEVGSLAKMSGTASKEISDLLEKSTHQVQELVKQTQSQVTSAMQKAQGKVARGAEAAKNCAENFDEIVADVERVTGYAQEISNASREQTQGLNEINTAMNQLDSSTQVNASSCRETSTAAQSLSQLTDSLKMATADLIQSIMGESPAAYETPPTQFTPNKSTKNKNPNKSAQTAA